MSEAKQKLLEATERMVYTGGICATGMDLIVKESGVARKTIYKHFRNKDELVAEALRERDKRWMKWFIEATSRADSAEERLLSCFDALEQWFATGDFNGCAFINAAGEVSDVSNPINIVAREHKVNLRNYLLQLTTEYGGEAPEALATEFLILIDGAITVAKVMANRHAARDARQLARKLLK